LLLSFYAKKKVIKTWLQKGKNNRRAFGPLPLKAKGKEIEIKERKQQQKNL